MIELYRCSEKRNNRSNHCTVPYAFIIMNERTKPPQKKTIAKNAASDMSARFLSIFSTPFSQLSVVVNELIVQNGTLCTFNVQI